MKRHYTDPRAALERMGIVDPDCVVFTDLDKTIRWDNQPVTRENRLALNRFRENGGLVVPISGSPIRCIPSFLRKPIALAEFGGVLCTKTRYWVLAPLKAQDALRSLVLFLGLYVEDGVQEVVGCGEVAVGGPRYATLNLNVGRHPAYAEMRYPAKLERLDADVRNYIKHKALQIAVTASGEYHSIDVVAKFWDKRTAVDWLLRILQPKRAYYMGDGETDLAAMLLPDMTAVGFENSIPEIQSLARERGIYVNKPGPEGGAAEALEIIQKREQAKLVLA